MFSRMSVMIFILILNNITAQIQMPSSGRIDLYQNFKSAFVTGRNIEVWLPDGYSNSKKYAVLYMHDGQMLFDSTTTWNKQSWEIDDASAQLMKKGDVKDFIVVGIWNGGETRHSDYFPQKPFEKLTPEQKDTVIKQLQKAGRTKETFKPNSENYLRFIVKELKPFIDSTYSVYKDKAHTFIMGSSMGGLISMYALTQYPEIFGGAACLSTHWTGTFQIENNPMPRAFALYLEESLNKLDGNKIYFDHGDKTLDSLYAAPQKMIDEVMSGYPKQLWESLYFKGNDHSEKSWKERVHIPVLFLFGKENK